MKSVLLSGLFFGAALSVNDDIWRISDAEDFNALDHQLAWSQWKAEFGREYTDENENSHRFLVFLDNWWKITKENAMNHTYTLGLNQFGDMTGDEFRYYVHGHLGSCLSDEPEGYELVDNDLAPQVSSCSSVDWEAKGHVTPVKNQGSCGSCWAFSATGCTESRYSISKGSLTELSEQELVDCSGSYGNNGCNGGLMDDAFKYIKANDGLAKESAYRYTGRDGTCKKSEYSHHDPISGYTDVTRDSSSSLQAAVCEGPVSIGIEADQFAFQYYSGGILDGTCGTRIDHGVLAVGLGESGGEKYWKVKNSWGSSWGDKGYVYICRECNKNGNAGECGILKQPSYVRV